MFGLAGLNPNILGLEESPYIGEAIGLLANDFLGDRNGALSTGRERGILCCFCQSQNLPVGDCLAVPGEVDECHW